MKTNHSRNELENSSGVYQIRNIINNKVYVGSTKNFFKRIYDHTYCLRNNIHGNSHLQNSFNEYGEENFIFEILEKCKPEKCKQKEQYWIDKLNVLNRNIGYNISPTTNNSIMSEESKLKISEGRLGDKNPMYGKYGALHHSHKLVVCFEKLIVYNSFHTIERLLNISGTHICACCRHSYGRNTVGGYKWFYLDEFKEKFPTLVNKLQYCETN